MSLNRVILLGRLGQDPELRFTQNQNPVCSFSVATGEFRKGQNGEWAEHTEWHNIVVWGKQAENCNQYLQKGREVLVEGRLQTRKWEDKDGNTRYKTEIVASNVQFIGGKGAGINADIEKTISAGSKQTPTPLEASASSTGPVSLDDDDIPF